MTIFPLTRDAALEIIGRYHRHNSRPVGYRFALGDQYIAARDQQQFGLITSERAISKARYLLKT